MWISILLGTFGNKNMNRILLTIAFVFIFQLKVLSQAQPNTSNLKDKRDNKVYKIIKIGDQIWMAENLSFEIKDGSWPLEMSEENREKAGLLYSWGAVKNACPAGWHLPKKEEWQQLINYVGKEKISEGALIKGLSNSTGFSAVHGGCIDMEGFFADVFAQFWTSSEFGEYIWYVDLDPNQVSIHKKDCKDWAGFSIRCVKN